MKTYPPLILPPNHPFAATLHQIHAMQLLLMMMFLKIVMIIESLSHFFLLKNIYYQNLN
jgi:xanthine/uracil permease